MQIAAKKKRMTFSAVFTSDDDFGRLCDTAIFGSTAMTNTSSHNLGFALWALVALAGAAAAAAPATDPVAARGLKATTQDRALVAEAIGKTNLLLGEAPIRLRPAWIAAGEGPGANAVPVYLVAAKDNSASSPAVVPKGCACVFVNPALLSQWAAAHSRGSGRMELDRGPLLVFMLLHEAGHLAKGTDGGAIEKGELTQYNVDPARAKVNEEDADTYAVELLRGYFRRTPATSTSLEANAVVTELVKLSWNMQAYRTIDEFAAWTVGKPSVYFDNGYTHPNLAWRVLRSNYLIHQNDATKMLLDDFEAARKRGANTAPVFDARKSGASPAK